MSIVGSKILYIIKDELYVSGPFSSPVHQSVPYFIVTSLAVHVGLQSCFESDMDCVCNTRVYTIIIHKLD